MSKRTKLKYDMVLLNKETVDMVGEVAKATNLVSRSNTGRFLITIGFKQWKKEQEAQNEKN